MKIAIVEDDENYAKKIIEYINEWAQGKDIFVEIFSYISAESFWEVWTENEDFDILFLDIKLDKMNGIELARLIRKTNGNVAIVFITIMKEYTLQGYTVSAMNFLLKPANKEECFDCLNKILQNNTAKKYYLLNDAEKVVKLPMTDIIYIKMDSHTATIITKSKEYWCRKTTAQILKELDDNLFVKCHKSYIINIRHVQSISKSWVLMSNSVKIPLSRDIAEEIYELFLKYNMNKV